MKFRWNPNIHNQPFLQILLFSLAIYVIFVYILTLNPFRFSLTYFHQYSEFRNGLIQSLIGKVHFYDVLLNLIMLLPVGFILGVYWRISDLVIKRAFFFGTAAGFVLSASIEITQIFLPRTSSILDIITNTLGCSAGTFIAFLIERQKMKTVLQNLYVKEKSFYLWIVFIYSIFATIILLIPTYLNHFGNWDKNYQLLIGNELTRNRPWQGTIYKASIFNKDLTQDKIETLYKSPYDRNSPKNCAGGLIAEYIFNTLPVVNRGYLGEEMDMYPLNPTNMEKDIGSIIENNNLFATTNGTGRFIQYLKDANNFSIALWIKPLSLHQSGPARIITLSSDTDNRNFTLGQSGAMLNFRVRTPLTGNNGSRVSYQSSPVLKTDEPQFVVATYNRGEMQLYFNGEMLPRKIYDTSPYLPILIGLRQDRFGKILFCFMLLFPLGWIARGLTYRPRFKLLSSSIAVFVPLIFSSLIKTLHFNHSLDFKLFQAATAVAVFVLFSGLLFDFLKHRYIRKRSEITMPV